MSGTDYGGARGEKSPANTHIDQRDTYFAVDSSSYFVFKSKSSAWVVSSAVMTRRKSVVNHTSEFKWKTCCMSYNSKVLRNILYWLLNMSCTPTLTQHFSNKVAIEKLMFLGVLAVLFSSVGHCQADQTTPTSSRWSRLNFQVSKLINNEKGCFFSYFSNQWTFNEKYLRPETHFRRL